MMLNRAPLRPYKPLIGPLLAPYKPLLAPYRAPIAPLSRPYRAPIAPLLEHPACQRSAILEPMKRDSLLIIARCRFLNALF